MKYFLTLLCFLFSHFCYSGDFRVGFGLGPEKTDINPEIGFNFAINNEDETNIATRIYAGYMFDNNWIIDIGPEVITDIFIINEFVNAFDSFDYVSLQLLGGYRFNFDKLYIEPRLGIADWDFTLKEGTFLNPGVEEESNFEGKDVIYGLGVGYEFNNLFGISLLYKTINIEPATIDTLTFNIDLKFKHL